jgi:hypothetical protein
LGARSRGGEPCVVAAEAGEQVPKLVGERWESAVDGGEFAKDAPIPAVVGVVVGSSPSPGGPGCKSL